MKTDIENLQYIVGTQRYLPPLPIEIKQAWQDTRYIIEAQEGLPSFLVGIKQNDQDTMIRQINKNIPLTQTVLVDPSMISSKDGFSVSVTKNPSAQCLQIWGLDTLPPAPRDHTLDKIFQQYHKDCFILVWMNLGSYNGWRQNPLQQKFCKKSVTPVWFSDAYKVCLQETL